MHSDTTDDVNSSRTDQPPRGGRLLSILTTVLVLVAAVLVVLYLIPAHYYMMTPGDALPVESMIAVKGHPAPATKGRLYLTDVTLYKIDHKLEELYGRLNPDAELQPYKDVSGTLSDKQFNSLNVQMMDQSISDAKAAALSQVPGYHPRLATTGPIVEYVAPHTPASARLKAHDVIEQVDGVRVRQATGVAPIVRKLKPGDVARLVILRGHRVLHLAVRTIASTGGQPDARGKTPLIGVFVRDQFVFPVHVDIAPGNIGGPSAGLMFSLGIIQHLVTTDLTHGCKIAGTGTIDFAGNVGEIGGAKQKIIAARRAGVQYFFVPDVAANRDPAMANRGNVTVVPVKTLHQALHYLEHLRPCR